MEVFYYVRETIAQDASWMEPSTIIATASALIALCAFFYTIVQTKQNQRHNRLTVRPHIQAVHHYSRETGRFSISIENYGLGPAIFDRVDSEIGQRRPPKGSYAVAWLLMETLPDFEDADVRFDTISENCALPVGDSLTLFSYQCSEENSENFMERLLRISKVTIKYRSAYGERHEFPLTSDDYRSA